MYNDPYGGIPRREDVEEMQAPMYQPSRVVTNEFDMYASFMSFRDVVLSTQGLAAVHALPSETSVKRWARRALQTAPPQTSKSQPAATNNADKSLTEKGK